jgi:hypothetical protein
MAITYNINILHLKGAPTLGELSNVITEVEFEVVAVDGEYTHNSIGHLGVTLNENAFTVFEDVTEEMVLGWIESHPVLQNHKNHLEEFINNMKVPTNVGMEKPWE